MYQLFERTILLLLFTTIFYFSFFTQEVKNIMVQIDGIKMYLCFCRKVVIIPPIITTPIKKKLTSRGIYCRNIIMIANVGRNANKSSRNIPRIRHHCTEIGGHVFLP